MTNALIDYFRCAGDVARFDVRGELSAEAGYFAFGGAVCHGRVAGAAPATAVSSNLPDAGRNIGVDGSRVSLPFDLADVVTGLREEHYSQNGSRSGGGLVSRLTSSAASRSLYYLVRPMLTVGVRKHLQRVRLRGWDKIPFPAWPVDTTVETLMATAVKLSLESTGAREMPFIWFWPEGAAGAAIVTHDVESPAGLAFCDTLMDIDDAAGFKASFQLVPEVRYETSRAVFNRLRRRGFEGNVHDLNHDGHLFHHREQFVARAAHINRYAQEFEARGFRSACMYREQQWFDVLDVAYDMSVPNVAHMEPQRGGCCTVLPYFIANIVELPLTTIQDYSLFHILGDYSIDLWKKQIDVILAHHGLITILTHPDYLVENRARRVYRDLLAYLRQIRDERQVWHALPGDVERWWRDRSRMTLVRQGDSWRVEGPGSERARVAFATVENDRVTYLLDRPAVLF